MHFSRQVGLCSCNRSLKSQWLKTKNIPNEVRQQTSALHSHLWSQDEECTTISRQFHFIKCLSGQHSRQRTLEGLMSVIEYCCPEEACSTSSHNIDQNQLLDPAKSHVCLEVQYYASRRKTWILVSSDNVYQSMRFLFVLN